MLENHHKPNNLFSDVNETIGSNLTQSIESIGVDLAQCQVFNITFTNLADQFLFDTYKANFLCRFVQRDTLFKTLYLGCR
ncbi:unnamed protein product [Caenorhabditis sp. 36 PRJEB53466]|nr:unnamed protein product [Caenorhabditis sp. 36 PRJEB53466]